MSERRRPRRGFTLVEMLVVISIIAILTSLITAAVFAALIAARKAANGLDMSQLEQGIEAYADTNQSYPPAVAGRFVASPSSDLEVANATAAAAFQRHLLKAYRNNTMNIQAMLSSSSPTPVYLAEPFSSPTVFLTNLDAAEALPFFLGGGLRNNKTMPISTTAAASTESLSFFQFVKTRLRDLDGDGLVEYLPPNTETETPYVYFNSDLFVTSVTSAGPPVVVKPTCYPILKWPNDQTLPTPSVAIDPTVHGVVRPYLDSTASQISFQGKNKYQLLCAGSDGHYGDEVTNAAVMGTYYAYPGLTDVNGNGANWAGRPQIRDNQASFSNNEPIENVLP